MAHRIVLDTSSLMYRAFFSLPPTVRDGAGRPVNAVHGYVDMMSYLIAERHPDEVIHCYDADWRPAERVRLYDGYKAHRPADPEGLPEQFGVLREVLAAAGFTQAEAPGWEGEDAIGALCAASPGDRFDIVTGDRDLIQLVRDPVVRVLFTVRGVTQVAVFDAQVQNIIGIASGIVDQMVGWGTQLDDLAAFSSPPAKGFYASQVASGNVFWTALHTQLTRYAEIMSFAATPPTVASKAATAKPATSKAATRKPARLKAAALKA